MSKPLRVAVISRHELTRAGLAHLIETTRTGQWSSSRPDGRLGHHDVAVYDLAGREPTEDNDLRRLIATSPLSWPCNLSPATTMRNVCLRWA